MSVGCHGPHRPKSTGFITNARTDKNGRFVLRVPPGKSWVYWNGPVTSSLRAEVHLGDSLPYEKDLGIVKNGQSFYGHSDFVEVRVEGGVPRYTRSGYGGMRPAAEIVLKAGQTHRMRFRLTPLRIKYRPDKVPIVRMSRVPPALILGATWRVEHPTPTNEDLRVRALMARATSIQVDHHLSKPLKSKQIGFLKRS
jgi:hypothetical protein